MTPTLAELEQRDLRTLAEACASEAGCTLEAMLGQGRRSPQVRGRLAFYSALDAMGWSAAAIARFCGKDPTTILWALEKKCLRVPKRDVARLGPSLADGRVAPAEDSSQVRLVEGAGGQGDEQRAAGSGGDPTDRGGGVGGVHNSNRNACVGAGQAADV